MKGAPNMLTNTTGIRSSHRIVARGLGMATALLAMTGVPPAAARADCEDAHASTATGSVLSVDTSAIVLHRAAKPDLRLTVDEGTSVAMDGRNASIAELRQGKEVRASYQDANGVARAIRIDAKGEGGSVMRADEGQAVQTMSPDDPEWNDVHQGG
jgi:hypothetical protein